MRGAAAQPFSSAYAASSTGSSHSVEAFSPGTPTERWLNQESRLAPCQCRTPGAMLTTSPGRSARAGLPASCYQPKPPTQTRICPPPRLARWMCQLFRQPGSKVTLWIGTWASVSGAR